MKRLIQAYYQAYEFSQKHKLGRVLFGLLVVTAIVLGVMTFRAFDLSAPVDGGSKRLMVLLYLDLFILLIIGIFVAQKLFQFRSRIRKSGTASKLEMRLVRQLGLIVVFPVAILTLFSITFFNMGIESWFSDRVHKALKNSTEVAEAYFEEHTRNIKTDVLAVAKIISEQLPIYDVDALDDLLTDISSQRSLSEAIIFQGDGEVVAHSRLTFSLGYEWDKIAYLYKQKVRYDPITYQTETKDRIRALVQVDPNFDLYLLVGRSVDPMVLEHVSATHEAVSDYHDREQSRGQLEIQFTMIYIIFTLVMFLLVLGLILVFAGRIVRPISMLTEAAEDVRDGKLSTRVDEEEPRDELKILARSFNRMTETLESQQEKLIDANRNLNRRRQLIETVFGTMTAGVLVLDANKKINMVNNAAAELLGSERTKLRSKKLENVIPEMVELLTESPKPRQIRLQRGLQSLMLMVHVAVETNDDEEVNGYVITFDDVTDFVRAQRSSAWADVARRVAHEIKNPLTPIQLSADRLKRKYSKEITGDVETFQRYIDTIIRQVSYIGEIVGEFSDFARMPSPEFQPHNIVELAEQCLFLQKQAHSNVNFKNSFASDRIMVECDTTQVTQVLTNILQNAIDALESASEKTIALDITLYPSHVDISIEDSGVGFPEEGREKLLEPYVTRREKGTGLGLAIVKRIMEEHNGELRLEDSDMGGARVVLRFPAQVSMEDAETMLPLKQVAN
ncbi:MAG: ATP-binding protein [Alphaproteobacteria bacterium]